MHDDLRFCISVLYVHYKNTHEQLSIYFSIGGDLNFDLGVETLPSKFMYILYLERAMQTYYVSSALVRMFCLE